MHQWSIDKLVPRGYHFQSIFHHNMSDQRSWIAIFGVIVASDKAAAAGAKGFQQKIWTRGATPPQEIDTFCPVLFSLLIHFVRCSFLYWYIFSVLFSLWIHFRWSTMSSPFEIDILSLIHYEYGGLRQIRGNINLKLMVDWLTDWLIDLLTTWQIEINRFQTDLSQRTKMNFDELEWT